MNPEQFIGVVVRFSNFHPPATLRVSRINIRSAYDPSVRRRVNHGHTNVPVNNGKISLVTSENMYLIVTYYAS